MKAVFVSKANGAELRTSEIVQPEQGEVLSGSNHLARNAHLMLGRVAVRNVCVASNPKDHKLSYWGIYEGVEGNDVAGYIESVGEGVEEFSKGDRVGAFTKMATHDKFGAYQEHSIAPASCTFPIADKTTFEDAATLPLAMMTAAIGLFVQLGLTPPQPAPSTTKNPEGTVVIHGASSSVGAFATQFAHLAKYKIVGIAGSSGDYAKSLGADVIVDYRNKSEDDLAKDIKEAIKQLGQPLVGVYDAVSELGPAKMLTEKVMQPEGGKMTTVLPVLEKDEESPENVKVIRTMVCLSSMPFDSCSLAIRSERLTGKMKISQ